MSQTLNDMPIPNKPNLLIWLVATAKLDSRIDTQDYLTQFTIEASASNFMHIFLKTDLFAKLKNFPNQKIDFVLHSIPCPLPQYKIINFIFVFFYIHLYSSNYQL